VSKVFELGILAIMQKHSFENCNEKNQRKSEVSSCKDKDTYRFPFIERLLSEISTTKMFSV